MTPLVVKISMGDPSKAALWARQTPMRSLVWRGVKFVVDEPVERCDWWVICHSSSVSEVEVVTCDPGHVVFVSMEPYEHTGLDAFYAQFSHVVATDPGFTRPDTIRRNGLTWWAGLRVTFDDGHRISPHFRYDYDQFSDMSPPAKQDRISVITSGKRMWPGHKARLLFLEKLRNHPISKHIDFYGGDGNPIEDKLDGLLGYKYHIALENRLTEHYWTEKLADPLLAFALPFYSGCTNIGDYLPLHSYIPIDITDFSSTVNLLREALETDAYSRSLSAITAARQRILNDYNIFQLLHEICDRPARHAQECRVLPAAHFYRSMSLVRRGFRRLTGLISRH